MTRKPRTAVPAPGADAVYEVPGARLRELRDAVKPAENYETALIAVKHHPDTPEHIRRWVSDALEEARDA